MLKQLEADFQNRLFFYPSDALYLFEIAKIFKLKENEYYKLYSLMGAQELENTLALYSKEDFLKAPARINLRQSATFIQNTLTHLKQNRKPFQTLGILSNDKQEFYNILKQVIDNPLAYRNIRIVLGTALTTKHQDNNFTTLVYGFNPFNPVWNEYIRKNRYSPKTFSSHANMLFSNYFGLLSLAAPNYNNDLVHLLVNQGLRIIETYLDGKEYDQEITETINKFGLLKTGGCSQ